MRRGLWRLVVVAVAWVAATTAHARNQSEPSVLDVPYVAQSPRLCGGACAAMVIDYWGGDASPNDFAGLIDAEAGGIAVGSLATTLRASGWLTRVFRATPGSVRGHLARGRPVIALIDGAPLHYVTIVSWDDERVVYHDPALRPFCVETTERFLHRWDAGERTALLVLPGPTRVDDAGDGAAGGTATSAVAPAVAMARRGAVDSAQVFLADLVRRRPDCAGAHRELAGIAFSQHRWDDAAASARRAVAIDPDDDYAQRVLGLALYAAGRREAALDALNGVDEPRIGRVEVAGARRARYRAVADNLGLDAGGTLTALDMRRAERRAASLPGLCRTRVDYRLGPDGAARVDVFVQENPPARPTRIGAARTAARAIARREVRVEAPDPFGLCAAWTASYRWWQHRPRVRFTAAVPGVPAPGWTTTVAGAWEQETFAAGEGVTYVETFRSAILSAGTWMTGRRHVALELGLRRGTATFASGAVSCALTAADDRVVFRSRGGVWWNARDAFAHGHAGVAAHTSRTRRGLDAALAAGVAAADAGAPRRLWPGAGVGTARAYLLRAHPLLDGGVIDGEGFGNVLAYATAEPRWWFPTVFALTPGAVVFADCARARTAGRSVTNVDVGAGLRLGFPGNGVLALDVGHGIFDGATALSLSFRRRDLP